MDLNTLLPIAVIGLILWGLSRRGAEMWHLLVAVIAGVVLSGTVLGPDVHQILSQLSGGHLH